jgi:predicted nucleic acid-binding Zn ribbon protein
MGEYSMQKAMKEFLEKSRLKGPIQSMQISEVWEEVMGKTVAKYTEKIELVQGTLFITTSVAPLKQELSFQKAKIAKRVNEQMGDYVIREVVIR